MGIAEIEGFSARVGSGVFSTRMVAAARSPFSGEFQCPCGLWGLFYLVKVANWFNPVGLWPGFSARVGSGVFSTPPGPLRGGIA